MVGAGAAGLTAALRAAEGGAWVTLLNAHPRIGLKILMSGGTRCNVTHREVSERDFNGGSRPFVRRVLAAFPPDETRDWLESLGVELKLEPTGKYFPVTDDAHTVLDALVRAVEQAGVRVEAGARVVRLERAPAAIPAGGADAEDRRRAGEMRTGVDAPSPRFRLGIQTVRDSAELARGVGARGIAEWPLPAVEPHRWLEADALIVATGGLSFPRTGSDGTGYALVAALGHTLEPPIPALTPLTADDALCRAAQGVTLDAELTLRTSGERPVTVRGSLLFTHFGYSGPAALDLSRHWLRAEGSRERRVTANFLPGERVETLFDAWREAAAREPRAGLRRMLGRSLPDRIAVELCGEAGIEATRPLSQVTREERGRLARSLCERPLPVTGTLGYEKAEVTAGGVRLSEVDPSTLESRVVPGLYLCGEILDVEGRLGGFNFQWSWSSGTVGGRSAAAS